MNGLPVIANLRNGLWYAPPHVFSTTCYFKSTDGHTSQWKFSSSRINLHVAQLAAQKDGCVIVDSTRRGKKFPDALYATLPIWMAVLNSLLFPAHDLVDLFHSPPWMPSSIRDQILQRLPSLLASISAFQKEVICKELSDKLAYPLRPLWVVPDKDGVLEWFGDISESFLEKIDGKCDGQGVLNTETNRRYVPMVLLSCSRDVDPKHQEDHCNWEYIKGAGDDEENWSRGLNPTLFWAHVEELLSPNIDAKGTEEVVDRLVTRDCNRIDGNPNSSIEVEDMNFSMCAIRSIISREESAPVNAGIRKDRKYILLHSAEINEDEREMIDLLTNMHSKFIAIEMKTGKRENAKNYWKEIVFPKCMSFVLNQEKATCFSELVAR